MASITIPILRDTILIYGRKPESWKPIDDLKALRNLKSYYPQLMRYNLDDELISTLIDKLTKQDMLR